MKMNDVSCVKCRFYKAVLHTEYEPAGECRRHAPTMLSGSGTGWSDKLFPGVNEGDWCGEFEPLEEE